MEIPVDLRSVVIVLTISMLSGISGKDAEVAESSPRTVFVRKSYHYPDYNQMPNRKFMPEGPQFWDSQLIPTVDPHIDSLMRSTAYLINTLHRLEVKFDRVFDAANFEENVAHDVMDKLRLIYKYIKGTSTNACQMDCSSSVNEMPQDNLMRELVDAVKYSNENIRRVATNFDMVMESGKRSMQSLERVAETVQDINERTIRIQQTSSGQFSGGSSHLYRDETTKGNPSITNTRVNVGSNNYEITERNKNFSTSDQLTQHLVTQMNHNSTDRRGTFNDNKNPSVASTRPAHESSGGEIHNWSKNSQANFNDNVDKNGNSDRGHQSGTGTLTSSNQPTQHIVTQTNYDSTDTKDFFNDNKNRSVASTRLTHESSGGAIHNWSRNSQANFKDNVDKNRNTDRGHQSGTGTLTNYDTNGRDNHSGKSFVTSTIPESELNQNRNSFAKSTEAIRENQNVGHNRSSYEERRNDFKESEIVDHNKTIVVSKPIVPKVNSWNSYETFVGESNQSQKLGHNANDQIGIQLTEQSNVSKGNVAFIDNKPPVESSSRSTLESSTGGNGGWNSHKSSNQEMKPGVAEANSYESLVNESNQSQKTGNNNNDRIGIQQTQESYVSNGNGAFIGNKLPVESYSRSTFESSNGENGSWNSHKTSNQEIQPGVAQTNSYESLVNESNQSQKIGDNVNDRIGIQQTEQRNVSKANGAFIDNKPPVQSSSRSTFESSTGGNDGWNSHKSSNQEIKSGVAQANSYESTVNEIFDQNFVASNKTNNETSGIALQGHNYASNSNFKFTENENVSRTSYDSRGSAVIDLNVNPVVTSTKTHHEAGKTEERSHFDNRNSYTSSGAKEIEVIEQKTSIAPSNSNDSITSVRKITTTTTTTTAKPQTTTTTARPQTTTTTARPQTTTTTSKPQESADTANSQRTYRHLRKDAKRVTFEPGKRNCHELTVKRNGIYKFGSLNEIANDGDRFFYERYCDFFTDNRAWTVIQRRFADYSEESFNRSWTDYKHGFGSLDEEFWFGNDFIHKLTFDDDVELRIILEDEDGNTNWVEYSVFKMKSERDNYKLVISGYSSGSVGDSLIYHNDQEFSTYDHLSGNSQQTSCASSIGNGWWFKNCSDKDILGNFLGSTSTKMMIRPKK